MSFERKIICRIDNSISTEEMQQRIEAFRLDIQKTKAPEHCALIELILERVIRPNVFDHEKRRLYRFLDKISFVILCPAYDHFELVCYVLEQLGLEYIADKE